VKCLANISKFILDQHSIPLVDINILSYNLCLWSVQVYRQRQHSFVSTYYNSDQDSRSIIVVQNPVPVSLLALVQATADVMNEAVVTVVMQSNQVV